MQNPVLLLHGIDDTESIFRRMRAHLEASGRAVYSLNLTPKNGAVSLSQLAHQVTNFVDAKFVDGQGIDLVGFSMGGIIARYYVQRLDQRYVVQRLVTLSSPHQGTLAAFLRWNEGAREMRPGSAFLRALNRDTEALDRVGFTSIWTPFDLMIVPARSSELKPYCSIRVPVAGHAFMLIDPRVVKVLIDVLDEQRS